MVDEAQEPKIEDNPQQGAEAWGWVEPMPQPNGRLWGGVHFRAVPGPWRRVVEPVQDVPQPIGYDLKDFWAIPHQMIKQDEIRYHHIVQFIADEVGLGVQKLSLFGSRRCYGAVKGSDWDVATEWTDELTRKLYDAGWHGKEPYPDDNTIQVFEKEFKDTKVQLVLVDNLKTHKDIWDSMTSHFWNTYINKRSSHYLGEQGVREFFNTMCRVHKKAREYNIDELV